MRNNCEELIFSDVRTFVRHVDEAPDKVYDFIIRLWKHLVLINKQSRKLKNARLDKHPTQPSPPPPLASNDSDDNSKQSKKTKSTKLPDPPMLTDGHTARFDIDVWKSKMVKKLTANANYYPTETLRIAYVNSRIDGEAYKHLAARSRISARKPFATVEKMFEVLQKTSGDVNQAHTAMNKF